MEDESKPEDVSPRGQSPKPGQRGFKRARAPHGSAKVYPDKRYGTFYVLFHFEGRRYQSRSFKQRCDADIVAARASGVLLSMKGGVTSVPPSVNVSEFVFSGGKVDPAGPSGGRLAMSKLIELYLGYSKPPRIEASTRATTQTHLRHLEAFLEAERKLGAPAALIDHAVFEKYKDHRLACGRSAVTVNKELATFRAMFTYAMDYDYLVKSPLRRVKDLSEEEPEPFRTGAEIKALIESLGPSLGGERRKRILRARILTEAEIPKVLDLVRHDDELFVFLAIDAFTGGRRGEIARLTWADVNLASEIPEISLRSKKQSKSIREVARTVPLNGAMVEILHGYSKATGGKGYLFPGAKPNTFAKSDLFHKSLVKALHGTAFEHIRYHNLRHTLESHLAKKGLDQREINAYMGHTTNEMAARYRHLLPEQKLKMIGATYDCKLAQGPSEAAGDENRGSHTGITKQPE